MALQAIDQPKGCLHTWLSQISPRLPLKGSFEGDVDIGIDIDVLPLKGSFEGDVDMGIDIDVEMDINSDRAVSVNSGSLQREL